MRRLSLLGAVLALALALVGSQLATSAGFAVDRRPGSGASDTGGTKLQIVAGDRTKVLGSGWRASDDIAWNIHGDGDGLRVLAADEADGYLWRTVTTLAEPGFETSAWIGNACANGDELAVTYAPREFTNHEELTERGAFVALVNLRTSEVRKLPVAGSLSYFSPSCGAGGTALFTQEGGEKLGATRLLTVDMRTAKVAAPIKVPGQLTSAVSTPNGIVAAATNSLVKITPSGARRIIARTTGVPFDLQTTSDGSVVYLEHDGSQARARRISATAIRVPTPRKRPALLAGGALTKSGLTRSAYGDVQLVGSMSASGSLPAHVSVVKAKSGSTASTRGRFFSRVADRREGMSSAPGDLAPPELIVSGYVAGTRKSVELATVPSADEVGAGADPGPFLKPVTKPRTRAAGRALASAAVAGSPTTPSDDDRACSVPRNDPRNQAMQPKPRQVEWAADQAVKGVLDVSRPANWKNLGMPAYTPQGLFPLRTLSGGGQVPAQILLGVMMQESNLWQASRHALPGVTGNPLVGNFYGLELNASSSEWAVDWASADCGYGVTQLTDGMRLAGKERPGETALPYQTQRAVALDFAANVAAGLRLLQDKWNQTYDAGLRLNNGDSSRIENWFYAVWAYNSGYHPLSEASANSGAWGVGWLNNPANPRYPANRPAFLDTTPTDAAHPQDWPYPEKVIGFAAQPIELLEAPNTYVPAYRPATWLGGDVQGPANRTAAKPPVNQFCDATDQCNPGQSYVPNAPEVSGEPAGPCAHKNGSGQYDLKCWYHGASTWKSDCSQTCGLEFIRFVPGYAYQDDATTYAPLCSTSGLPAGAKIIDDVADGVPSVRPDCPRSWTNAGTFTTTFKPAANSTYPGKIDFHQIGGGFGGHFWFAHTRTTSPLDVSATWKLSTTRNGVMQIYAALPDHGAHTSFASYAIKTATGVVNRVVKQPGDGNRWVSLGVFKFNGYPEVTLTSVTANGTGDEDIAFDAMAFVPRTGTLKTQSVEAVSEFDEDQNIDVSSQTSWLGGILASRQTLYGWAYDNSSYLLGQPSCTSGGQVPCLPTALRSALTTWKNQVVAAGTDPVNHPDGNSIGTWIGFAQPYTDRPTSTTRPAWFSDDNRVKIRSKITVTYLTDISSKIIPGSEYVEYSHRTGNTHLPVFLRNLIAAVQTDYGIAPPDLTYTTTNLNEHNGAAKTINPLTSGLLPGRAYAYAADYSWLGIVANSGGTCVATEYISGGSIGYRSFLGAQGGEPARNFKDWLDDLQQAPRVPQELIQMLAQFYGTMLDPADPEDGGSNFSSAPPIWLDLSVGFCPNGTIQQVNGLPILRASHMPDVYLYHNDKAMLTTGKVSYSKLPVLRGDFSAFSRAPAPGDNPPAWDNPFGPCDSQTGRSGNPWDMTASPFYESHHAYFDKPTAHSCLDASVPMDPAFSSP